MKASTNFGLKFFFENEINDCTDVLTSLVSVEVFGVLLTTGNFGL